MFTTSRLAIALALLFCVSTSLTARQQADAVGPRSSPVITAATAGEKVRFISSGSVCQIRVQILSPAGEALFDSAWREGNVLDWPIEPAGQPLTSGSYRCVVMVKDLDGQVSEKEATLIAQGGRVSIEQRPGAEGITIIGADENGPKMTLLAHDGEKGAVVSTSGDLSFRFGNFLSGKDSERMRLTAEGNLGIGTDTPQAPLDVNGLIRTSKGILFPDGTTLTTAAGLHGAEENPGTTRQRAAAPGGAPVILRGGVGPGFQAPSITANRLRPGPAVGPDYQFKVDGLGVHIGTTSAFGLDVAGNVTLSSNLALPLTASGGAAGVITLDGNRFAHAFGSVNTFLGVLAGNFTMTGNANTASGYAALYSNTTGSYNTANGLQALYSNTTGSYNTANGLQALYSNTDSSYNTASGGRALYSNTTGYWNTANGSQALFSNTDGAFNTASGHTALYNNTSGSSNTANGLQALYNNTGGSSNTASGYGALYRNTTGVNNIAIGDSAGTNLTTGNSNIDIGNGGVAAEAGTIRIGQGGSQTRAFVAGIRGVTTGSASAIPVLIDSAGQLGTASSSRRYKFDIADVGEATEGLMRLRPVSFRYLAHGDNAPLQYGLIAEEVAEVYPEMVARDKDGQVETVMYQFLAPMLLNEVQKQHRQIEEQQKTIDAQQKQGEEQQKTIDAQQKQGEEQQKTIAALGKRLEAFERLAAHTR